jgi:hypothetical protein
VVKERDEGVSMEVVQRLRSQEMLPSLEMAMRQVGRKVVRIAAPAAAAAAADAWLAPW